MEREMIHTILDERYRIDATIGEGGTARVFRAFDLKAKREVAVKILSKDTVARDPGALQRFSYEAKAYTLLENHPNIISAYDISLTGEEPYIVMELAIGESLAHRINYFGGRIPTEETLNIAFQILSALAFAHEKNIIHRDIKPRNIIVMEGGLVKLGDFGIARLPGMEDPTDAPIMASIHYVSPEQALGRPVDPRSDIYSVGIVLYEMLTGQVPFSAKDTGEVIHMHLKEMPVKPSSHNPNIPTGLEQIVLKALSKSPAKRFGSCREMMRCLQLVKEDPRVVFDFGTDTTYDEYAALPEESAAERFAPFHEPGKKEEETPMDDGGSVREKKLTKILTICFASCFLIALCFVSVFSYRIFFAGGGERTVITPGNLKNKPYDQALLEELTGKGYEVEIQYEYSSEYAAGTVIRQQPAAATAQRLSKGENPHLTLTVSAGCRVMVMQDYRGQEYRKVQQELQSLGFSVKVEKVYAQADAGAILSTDPAEGDVVDQTQTIRLKVSQGEAVTYGYMPSLVGMSVGQATEALAGAGLRLGGIVYEESDGIPGIVTAQNRPAGEKVATNDRSVILTVAKKKVLS